MKTATSVTELNHWLNQPEHNGKSIGFIPTMGALHEGHLSLIDQSVEENDLTISSVFVNPIQFNNPEDLRLYPRMPLKDSEMLASRNCDLLFMPSTREMYPEEISKQYDFGLLDTVMEGAFRPGHFNGVAIVVHRLFTLINPHRAYFGLKDYQQFMVIKAMVEQEDLNVELIGCETIREQDGLAMSSRNMRLTPSGRSSASMIYASLQYAREQYADYSVKALETCIEQRLDSIPGSKVEYVAVADSTTLNPIAQWKEVKHCVMCVAVYVDNVRLIDNIILF